MPVGSYSPGGVDKAARAAAAAAQTQAAQASSTASQAQATAAAAPTSTDVTNAIKNMVPSLIPPATSRRLWSQMAIQTGDQVSSTAGTGEQTFASRGQIPGPLVIGEVIRLHGGGLFTTSSLLVPTQRARVRWGVNGPVLIDTGQLAPLIGASAGRYWFDVNFIVRTVGIAGSVECFGSIKFANALFGTSEALVGPSGAFGDSGNPVTIDTTQAATDLPLSMTFSSSQSGNTNTLRWSVLHDLRPATS